MAVKIFVSPQAKETEANIIKWGLNLKALHSKGNYWPKKKKKEKKNLLSVRKYLQLHGKRLISKIPIQLLQLNLKKTQFSKWAEDLNRHFPIHTDGQQLCEKMLNTTNQRNTNQNLGEISAHTSQNGYHQKEYK